MSTALNIPQDATTDDTFRCVKWSCVMAYRHCLRRQTDALQRGPLAKDRTPIPVHPYCARKCEDGQAISERFGKPAQRIRGVNAHGKCVYLSDNLVVGTKKE